MAHSMLTLVNMIHFFMCYKRETRKHGILVGKIISKKKVWCIYLSNSCQFGFSFCLSRFLWNSFRTTKISVFTLSETVSIFK